MKPFLLIAWDDYYPAAGTDNWIATFATKEEAESVIEAYPRSKNDTIYKIHVEDHDEDFYDNYKIVDLRRWIGEFENHIEDDPF